MNGIRGCQTADIFHYHAERYRFLGGAASARAFGRALELAAADFGAVLTADQNLEHQQSLRVLPIAVIVLVAPTNRIDSLRPLIPTLLQALQTLAPRRLVHVRA